MIARIKHDLLEVPVDGKEHGLGLLLSPEGGQDGKVLGEALWEDLRRGDAGDRAVRDLEGRVGRAVPLTVLVVILAVVLVGCAAALAHPDGALDPGWGVAQAQELDQVDGV